MKKTALELAREKVREMAEAGIAIERLDPIEKARRNPKSLRLAITAKCWDCVGAGEDPKPRQAIQDCPCGKHCPLWPVRPYQELHSTPEIQSGAKLNGDETTEGLSTYGDEGESKK